MDYETALKTCSAEVQAAIKWLEEQVRFDRRKLENWSKEERDREYISQRLKAKYFCSDAIEFYLLSKVNSPLLKEFLDAAKKEEFWLDEHDPDAFAMCLFEDPYLLWYLSKVGLNTNEFFKEVLEIFIKKPQTLEGKISPGGLSDISHPLSLSVLVSVEPSSEATDLAVRCFLDNLDKFKNRYSCDLDYEYSHSETLAIGVLALCELDYLKYKETIEDLCKILKSDFEQGVESYWGEIDQCSDGTTYLPLKETSLAIEALARVFGPNDDCVIKAIESIKRNQKEDGSWGNIYDTAYACLALISAGDGPKVSLDENEWNELRTKQKLELTKPMFIQTSPNLGATEIKEKISEMLNNANERIWICSRFITEFWTDIMNLKREKPKLDVKIITLPKAEAHNKYKGTGRKFVQPAFDALQRLLGNDFITEPLLHARLYIVDNEVLVSSADISSEQLEKEFNAGIWTRDEETVEAALKFFENIWKESKDETQSTEVKRS
ncbi:PLD-like domain-containing protein [Candidatus Methanophagaceae archaeon]|nr:PLD-like domain-containing protein [Methanophagales archaeon]